MENGSSEAEPSQTHSPEPRHGTRPQNKVCVSGNLEIQESKK
jgi:hypothetical protein